MAANQSWFLRLIGLECAHPAHGKDSFVCRCATNWPSPMGKNHKGLTVIWIPDMEGPREDDEAIKAWLLLYKNSEYELPNEFLFEELSSYNKSFLQRVCHEVDSRVKCGIPIRIWSAGSGIDPVSMKLKEIFRDKIELTILDVSPECIHMNEAAFEKRGLHADFVVGNLFEAKYEQRFDIVMNTGLLEHFSTHGQTDLLRIFSNSLKPGGVYLTYVPYAGGRLYKYCMERMIRIGNWKVGPEVPIETFREMNIEGLVLVEEYPLDALYQLAFLRGAFPILGILTLPVVMVITRLPSVFELPFLRLISGYGLFAEFRRIEGV